MMSPLKGSSLLGGARGYGRFRELLPPRPFAHGFQIELEFPGNLPQAQPLFREQEPDLAIGGIIDHG